MKRRSPLKRKSNLRPKVSNSLRRGPIKKVNRQRKAKEWTRAYGSEDYVLFTQQSNCVICGETPCEVAHTPSRSGMSRKGDFTTTLPCCPRCHRFQHQKGWGLLMAVSPHRVEGLLRKLCARHQLAWERWQANNA